jgi:FkbM family methyltransferase
LQVEFLEELSKKVYMKKLIKIIFPESIKKILRKTENFFFRLRYGFTKPVVLKDIFGIRFLLYPEEKTPIRWSIERGAYKKEYSAMNKLVKAGDIVFDVGSHIGVVACYLRTRATESGKIYAFEPFSKSYQRLCENIALNSYKNVYTNNVAISDEIGVAKFYYEPRDNQLNSLGKVSNGTNQLSESVDVNTETIDSYCEQNKINLEMFCCNVLHVAPTILSSNNSIKSILLC